MLTNDLEVNILFVALLPTLSGVFFVYLNHAANNLVLWQTPM